MKSFALLESFDVLTLAEMLSGSRSGLISWVHGYGTLKYEGHDDALKNLGQHQHHSTFIRSLLATICKTPIGRARTLLSLPAPEEEEEKKKPEARSPYSPTTRDQASAQPQVKVKVKKSRERN